MKKEKRVGIITHYHGSLNYGGVLQAYALCKFLNQNNVVAEQIDYDYMKDINNSASNTVIFPKRELIYLKRILLKLLFQLPESKKLGVREKAFKKFRDNIPHTSNKYHARDINRLSDTYDCCIVGSDQVWNPDWYCEPFFLSFTSAQVKRVSYAASIGKQRLTIEQKNKYKSLLANFDYISVRERSAAKILEELSEKKIETLLDPTLLLEKKEWDIVTPDKIPLNNYIFCYFLSKDNQLRVMAEKFAQDTGLTLVNLMHADGFCKYDIGMNCSRIYDAGPLEFLSLIKYSDYILTDSFHASVFSCIFEKQFFVFGRADKPGMSERLMELSTLFNIEDHIIMPDQHNINGGIEKRKNIIYKERSEQLTQKREKSKQFLNMVIETI